MRVNHTKLPKGLTMDLLTKFELRRLTERYMIGIAMHQRAEIDLLAADDPYRPEDVSEHHNFLAFGFDTLHEG